MLHSQRGGFCPWPIFSLGRNVEVGPAATHILQGLCVFTVCFIQESAPRIQASLSQRKLPYDGFPSDVSRGDFSCCALNGGHQEDLCNSEPALWLQGALKFEGAFISVPFYLTRPTVYPGSKGSGASIGSPAVHLLCYTCTILDCPQRQDVRETRDHLLCASIGSII